MQKCFYLICPTDSLESVINNTFGCENYFYTSLGNSFSYDARTIAYISQVIEKQNIKEICFVLSLNNKVVLDVLQNNVSSIRRLDNFYCEISKQEKRSKAVSQKGKYQFSVLSYYLNFKIKDLQLQINNLSDKPITISGKIYNEHIGAFADIYSDLVCLDKYHLN